MRGAASWLLHLLLLSSAASATSDTSTCNRKTLFGKTILGASFESFDPLFLNERVGMQEVCRRPTP